MLDRLHALRAVSGKAALGLVLGSTLLLSACGSGSAGGPSTTTNAALTACTATVSDLSTGAGGTATATKVAGISGKIAIDGSSALAPLFQAAGQEFDVANGTQTTVTPNGSGNGLKDVEGGAVQIGLSDVYALQKEPTPGAYHDLVDHQVAVVAFTLVTNNDLKGKVNNLTVDQIKQIYTGQISNWSQLGGPNEQISVVNRPTASGTRATFKVYVLGGTSESAGTTLTQDTTGAVATAVGNTPGAIGYVATGFVTGQYSTLVAPICIGGYAASAKNIGAGNYQFWGIEHAYTKGPASGAAKALLQYAVSSSVQQSDLPRLSYLQASSLSASALASHTPTGAPAPESLS
ncbi:MAG TPA: phosphate ABC transporter substrate-binding protein [Ktedonobacterales bacterium]|nr:phosphate ABC transporter substrate-binding protein [Ktedonobacterales bacterium]